MLYVTVDIGDGMHASYSQNIEGIVMGNKRVSIVQ